MTAQNVLIASNAQRYVHVRAKIVRNLALRQHIRAIHPRSTGKYLNVFNISRCSNQAQQAPSGSSQGHRVAMKTMANSDAIAVRLQKTCMAQR
jgi:hypothetical protein